MFLLLAGCGHVDEMPEVTSLAVDVYNHYADREEFTVALIGDYRTSRGTYNVVMFQAPDSAAWDLLDQEFIIIPRKKGPIIKGSREEVRERVWDTIDSYLSDVKQARENEEAALNPDLVKKEHEYTPAEQWIRKELSSKYSPTIGYMRLADNTNHILWLFFFASEEDLHAIINNLFDKIDTEKKPNNN